MDIKNKFPYCCKYSFRFFAIVLVAVLLGFAVKTWLDIQPVTQSLRAIILNAQNLQVTDRNTYPLSISYQNRWNTYDNLPLYQIPDFLKQAFIVSEDQNFYEHQGVDWRARLSAVWQNLRANHAVRGASTISEQVVRMLHPRPRTLWSKWIESWEVSQLEKHYKKADILEFYLNQLPYAANRRGVLQATHYYFNRDLTTLSHKEMLALVVLARAPSSFDLYHDPTKINTAILRLANTMAQRGLLGAHELAYLQQQSFQLSSPEPPINAAHFVNFVRKQSLNFGSQNKLIKTTLDAALQRQVQAIIDERIKSLVGKNVQNAAALVVDHTTGEILAWVIGGANSGSAKQPVPGYQIDAVTVPRQPGSTLKPFLYALALESGWSAATLIEDAPFATAIGTGLHRFKNYSNTYYGNISLREALGNSLNIPALRTIQFVGKQRYLDTLHALGFGSLNKSAAVYDEGLALGNGEVTLLELVTAYATLAHQGSYRPLHFMFAAADAKVPQTIFSAEASSLIANILSDSWARRLEFGMNSVLNLPIQTAIKTGTSTDYHDAWVVGFNYRYVVGIWMGNLDRTPTNGITGSIGPALAMRSIFALLNQHQNTASLYLSPKLVRKDICIKTQEEPCLLRTEYFISGTEEATPSSKSQPSIGWIRPTEGLQIAIDPRIPRKHQQLEFAIQGLQTTDQVDWLLNGETLAHTTVGRYLWPLQRGHYTLRALVNRQGEGNLSLPEVNFWVK